MTHFNANCTLPPTIVNFVSSPNSRGTFDILWSCLTTILLCTWSVQHPNVPVQESGWRSKLKAIRKKVIMMLFTVLAPEVLLLKAIGEFSSVVSMNKILQKRADKDGSEWTRVHTFFANMGGFVIHFTPETPYDDLPKMAKSVPQMAPVAIPLVKASNSEVHEPPSKSTTTAQELDVEKGVALIPVISNAPSSSQKVATSPPQSKMTKLNPRNRSLMRILASMTRTLPESSGRNTVLVREIIEDLNKRTLEGDSSAFIIDDYILNLARLGDYNWALDGPQLITAREMGIIDCLPKVLQSEIEDKSNSDFLMKFVAVAQVVWQIIQLIIRWTKGLPSSQAEVATVGFSFCAFIMYLAFWSKPQDVETPYVVKAKRYPTKEEILQLAERGPILDGIWTGYSYSVPEHAIHSDLRDTHEKGLDGGVVGWAGVALGGVLFGLMHVSAWSFNFPTPIERLLWRITSTITTILPVLSFARGLCWLALARRKRDPSKGFINANALSAKNPAVQYIGIGGLVIYILSRLYLIIETFRSLLYLLPDTYQTTM